MTSLCEDSETRLPLGGLAGSRRNGCGACIAHRLHPACRLDGRAAYTPSPPLQTIKPMRRQLGVRTRWNLVSPYTSSSRPAEMTDTTAARLLHSFTGSADGRIRRLAGWNLLGKAAGAARRAPWCTTAGRACSEGLPPPPLPRRSNHSLSHQLGFSMPQAMAKKSRKRGVVDLHIT